MEIKILQRKQNTLLKREEVFFEASDFNSTPNRKEILDKIASELGAKAEMVVIDRIRQWFGTRKIEGKANLYSDANMLKKIEKDFLTARTHGKKPEKKGQKPEENTGGK